MSACPVCQHPDAERASCTRPTCSHHLPTMEIPESKRPGRVLRDAPRDLPSVPAMTDNPNVPVSAEAIRRDDDARDDLARALDDLLRLPQPWESIDGLVLRRAVAHVPGDVARLLIDALGTPADRIATD